MAGLLGTRSWMARKAGSTTSKAKAEAARENGKKGGRPRQAARGKTLKREVSP
jgi:DNA invertase Pin-like site-specific DNA recombinase